LRYHHSNIEIISLLLERGADINSKSNHDETILHMACYCNNFPIVEFLLEKGADINSKNNKGETSLHYACEGKLLPMIKFLLERGAKVEYEDGKPTCLNGEENEEISEMILSYETKNIKGVKK
jgi:ankyrin repeat protein